MDGFAGIFFDDNATQDKLHAALNPVVERFQGLEEAEKQEFRGQLVDYVRLYAFLSQILTFTDTDLERL